MDSWARAKTAEIARILRDDTLCLYRITLPAPIPGYRDFLTPWLLKEEDGRTFVADVGPRATVASLVSSLREMGIRTVDYVLLTHVHIDHMGGIADFLLEYPEAKVIAHPKGQPHLVDPSRLWNGSLQTLGDVAKAYGEILPVAEGNVLRAPLKIPNLSIIETPGHAPHHQSYLYFSGAKRILFAGEAAGVYYPPEYFPEVSGASCNHPFAGSDAGAAGFYLRPATPPRFFYDMTIGSLQKVREARPDFVCYGHYGYSSAPDRLMDFAEKQLIRWREILSEVVNDQVAPETGVSRLLADDSLLDRFRSLPEDVQKRERYFLRNSVLGFLGYLSSN